MIPTEYAEMVGLIKTWWGPLAAGPWEQSENFDLFEDLQTDPVFETLTALRDSGRYADWPPKPPALRAAALDLIRNQPGGALALPAAPVETFQWAEYSKRTYGEMIPMELAVSLSAAAQDAGVPTPSPQNPWRRPDEGEPGFMAEVAESIEEDAPGEPFDPLAASDAWDPIPGRENEPEPPENGPEIVARSVAKRGGPCDHCGQKIDKGASVIKVAPRCCDRHQRPSRTSGGAGSWICEQCAP